MTTKLPSLEEIKRFLARRKQLGSAPEVAAGHTINSYPTCPDDGFPLIKIGGQLQCCAEALNRCVGEQKVVDVVRRGQTIYYVFEDGHKLPLLCGCCGGELLFDDLEQERKRVCGRQLGAMGIGRSVINENEQEYDELILEFSEADSPSDPVHIAVAFESAAQLYHPAAGRSGKRKASSKKRTRSKSKGRFGKKRGRKKKKR